MATATVDITITGGTAPAPVSARLFIPGGTHLDISSSTSFSHTFTLAVSGGYQLMVSGMNPSGGGSTKIVVTTADGATLNPPESSPKTETGLGYLDQFNIQVP